MQAVVRKHCLGSTSAPPQPQVPAHFWAHLQLTATGVAIPMGSQVFGWVSRPAVLLLLTLNISTSLPLTPAHLRPHAPPSPSMNSTSKPKPNHPLLSQLPQFLPTSDTLSPLQGATYQALTTRYNNAWYSPNISLAFTLYPELDHEKDLTSTFKMLTG